MQIQKYIIRRVRHHWSLDSAAGNQGQQIFLSPRRIILYSYSYNTCRVQSHMYTKNEQMKITILLFYKKKNKCHNPSTIFHISFALNREEGQGEKEEKLSYGDSDLLDNNDKVKSIQFP